MSPSWALRILLAMLFGFLCFKADFNKNNSYQYVVNHTIIKFICIFSCMQMNFRTLCNLKKSSLKTVTFLG